MKAWPHIVNHLRVASCCHSLRLCPCSSLGLRTSVHYPIPVLGRTAVINVDGLIEKNVSPASEAASLEEEDGRAGHPDT